MEHEAARNRTLGRSLRTPALGGWLPASLAIGGVAVAARAFSPGWLNYDATYGLVWGRELALGRIPDYTTIFPAPPTPRPLVTGVSAAASLLGRQPAYDVMVGLAFLAFGALVWGVFRLAQAGFSTAAGVAAAAVVATNENVLALATGGYQDIPFVAFVLGAALLEMRSPRRGAPVLGMLALAGLIRPEAWLLAAAYWLYLAPALDLKGRLRAGALAAVAPALWAASDLAITGDALYSLTETREGASVLGRPTGIDSVPKALGEGLERILGPAVLAGGVAGLVVGAKARDRRVMVPIVLVALTAGGFAVLGLAGLPLRERYLSLPAVLLATFFAFALLGWRSHGLRPLRELWIGASALLFVGYLALLPDLVDGLRGLREFTRFSASGIEDLRDLARHPSTVSGHERCPPVHLYGRSRASHLSFYLGDPPRVVYEGTVGSPGRGVLVAPAKSILGAADISSIRLAGFRRVTGNRTWDLYDKRCLRRRGVPRRIRSDTPTTATAASIRRKGSVGAR
jgi:hypothetical protein